MLGLHSFGASVACALLLWPSVSFGQTVGQDQTGDKSPDIVVVGRYGEADLRSETELDEQDVADYAASSIRDLLQQISPLIDGTEDQPILLVNGKRIADPRDIRGYPPEALQRVEILPREAAAHYGYAPERRVVNLVLKKQFSGLTGEASLSLPTAGGRDSETLQVQRVAIDGDKRWNVEASVGRESLLLDSARDVPVPPGTGSIAGNVLAIGAGELDPGLSLLTGRSVMQAAVPPGAADHPLALSDFIAGAGTLNLAGDARFRTLSPATDSASFNTGFNRPLGAASLSLNLRATKQSSRQLLGLAPASLLLPADSPFSPFSQDVTLERLLAGTGPLRATSRSTSLGFSSAINGMIGQAHATLSLTYDHNGAESRTERAFDLTDATARIAAGDPSLNPFGPLPLGPLDADRTRSSSDSLSAQLVLGDKILTLPAGPAQWTLNSSFVRAASRTSFDGESGAREERRASSQGDVRLSLGVPLTSRRTGALGALGELSLQLSGGGSLASGTPMHTRLGAGLAWTPFPVLSLNAIVSQEEDAPSAEQRDAPIVETPDVRIYDYTRGELAEVSQITGGNPALGHGSSRTLSIGGTIRPLGGRRLTLNMDYRRREARGGIGSLPTLTPAVEAAFPDRVRRDADGRLISVDMRPINLARDLNESLRTRLTWSHTFGAMPQPGAASSARGGERAPPGALPAATGGPQRLGSGRGGGRIELSLNHGWQLRNALLIRTGLPVLDRLNGDGGGQSRHTLQAQALVASGGASLSFDLRWQSAYRTRASTDGTSAADLHFAPATNAGLKLSFDLGRLAWFGRPAWLRATQLSLDISNLFDTRLRVTRGDGTVPAGYTRDEVDPIGRLIKMSLRRRL